MKELYYPSFEIVDEKWLKYAILYKENVSTIVPSDYRSKLSDKFIDVHQSTDLMGFYDISQKDIEIIMNTSSIVLNILEDVARFPESYPVERYWKNCRNLDEILKYADKQYTIVTQKLNISIERELIMMGYAQQARGGIKVHYILGCFYMSVLASSIAGINNDLVATTDITTSNLNDRIFNRYLPVTRTHSNYFERDRVKQMIIHQAVPNLDALSINDAIEIRNKSMYRRNLESFNKVIEEIINLESGYNLNLREIDRQLTFYSDEMAGIREDVIINNGILLAGCLISFYYDSFLPILGGEILKTIVENRDSSSGVKLRDVSRTKKIITDLRNV